MRWSPSKSGPSVALPGNLSLPLLAALLVAASAVECWREAGPHVKPRLSVWLQLLSGVVAMAKERPWRTLRRSARDSEDGMNRMAAAAFTLLMLGGCGQNESSIADDDTAQASAIEPAGVSGKSDAAKPEKSASRSVRSASGGFAETRWCRAERVMDARIKPDVPADRRETAGVALQLMENEIKEPSGNIPWFCVNVEDGNNPPVGLFWGGRDSLCDDQRLNVTGDRFRFEGSCRLDKNAKTPVPVLVEGQFTPNGFIASPTWDHGDIAITYQIKGVIREPGMKLTDQRTAWQ